MNAQNDTVNRLVEATTKESVREILKELPPVVYKNASKYLGLGLILLIVFGSILTYVDKDIPEAFVALVGVLGGALAGLLRG